MAWKSETDERGASLVEFALIFPVFALLLFGLVDFGLVFGGFISLRNGVATASRSAAVDSSPPSCASATNPMICTVQDDVGSLTGVVPGSVEVSVSFPTGTPAVGQPVLVCASAELRSTTGITAPLLDGRRMFASSEARLEQTPSYAAGSAPSSFTC